MKRQAHRHVVGICEVGEGESRGVSDRGLGFRAKWTALWEATGFRPQQGGPRTEKAAHTLQPPQHTEKGGIRTLKAPEGNQSARFTCGERAHTQGHSSEGAQVASFSGLTQRPAQPGSSGSRVVEGDQSLYMVSS